MVANGWFRAPPPQMDQTFDRNVDARPPIDSRPENPLAWRHLQHVKLLPVFSSVPAALALYKCDVAPQTPHFLLQHRKNKASRADHAGHRAMSALPSFARSTVNSNSRKKQTLGDASGILTVDTNPDYTSSMAKAVQPRLNPRRRSKGEALVQSTNLSEVNLLRNEPYHEPVFDIGQLRDSGNLHPKEGFGTKRPHRDSLGIANRYISSSIEPHGYAPPSNPFSSRTASTKQARRAWSAPLQKSCARSLEAARPQESTCPSISIAGPSGEMLPWCYPVKVPPSSPGSLSTGVPSSPVNVSEREEGDTDVAMQELCVAPLEERITPVPGSPEKPGSDAGGASSTAAGSTSRSVSPLAGEYDSDDFEDDCEDYDVSDWEEEEEEEEQEELSFKECKFVTSETERSVDHLASCDRAQDNTHESDAHDGGSFGYERNLEASGISIVTEDSAVPVLEAMKQDSDFQVTYTMLGGDLKQLLLRTDANGLDDGSDDEGSCYSSFESGWSD